jgi:DNA helicase-2/ATP-dependent DNA helicase PcrA
MGEISSTISAILIPMKSSKGTPASAAFTPDEHQQQAIEHLHGPMLVVAGAGTGKTTVLTRRIARLIREGHARADEILALTYTDNAAREMRERVQKELGTQCKVQATTFHSYCFSLLDRCGKKFGVLDDKDLWIYLRKRIRELHLNYFVRAANVSKFLDDLLDFMRRCQDELVGPEKYAEYVRRLERAELPIPRVTRSKDAPQISDDEVLGRCQEIASVFKIVENMLASEELGTFGHMISRAHDLLSSDPGLTARERAAARFILVDEFQDANFAQVKVLGLLAGDERNVFAVGDPDQAIYRFRGASSAAFGLFQRHFPEARLVSLQKNQRSLAPILQCAYAAIAKNPPALSGPVDTHSEYRRSPLRSAREERKKVSDPPSERIQAVLWRDRDLESADLVGTIRQQHRKLRYPWNKFAVIYRNHSHRDEVVEELSRWNIPYSIENMDVLDTPEVRDLLGCLGVVVSVQDSASLFRVAALPQFGIDPEFLRLAMKTARRDITLSVVLEQVTGGSAVLKRVEEAREQIKSSQAKARAALEILIRHFNLDRNSPALNAVLQFAQSWEQKAVTKTGEIGELLEYLEYFREARGSINLESQAEDAVRLMTAHGAKGLEFDHVFVLRAYSGCFPSGFKEQLFEFPRELRDPDSAAENDGKHLNEQEERRLFYVAMTRARDSLTIYAKQGMGKDPTPPGFVRDLLKDNSLGRVLLRREARPIQVDLFAGEQPATALLSNASQWLAMEPSVLLTTTLSATSIERYELCPLQFKLEREWRIPGEVPAAMQYGASIHRVLRAYYDGLRFGRPMSDEALLQFFRDDLAQARIEEPYQHDLYERQGLDQLRDFLAKARSNPQPEVMFTEQEFKIRIGEANVVGRIDRIDRMPNDGVAIFDYKTGKPRSQEDADESLQLSIYALAAAETWGVKPDRLLFYNLEDNSAVATGRSESQLQDARAKVEEVGQKITARDFEAKTGFHCTFCAYRNLCPATEKRIYSVQPAKQAASRGN